MKLMAHVYYGDPTEGFSLKQIKALADAGADFIEFGIPFSDPTSDGPTFQEACARAIKNGMTPPKCIEGIKKVRKLVNVPIIVTTYYNIIYRMGIDKFTKAVSDAGAQGVIVPNLPIEESELLINSGKKYNLDIIQLVTSATSEQRLKKIIEKATGFLYLVSRPGVTGAKENIPNSTKELIQHVRKHTKLPLLVGFGISKPEHAAEIVSAGADGVILGSAFAKIYEKNLQNPKATLPEITNFARAIKSAMCKRLCSETIKAKEVEN